MLQSEKKLNKSNTIKVISYKKKKSVKSTEKYPYTKIINTISELLINICKENNNIEANNKNIELNEKIQLFMLKKYLTFLLKIFYYV